MVDESSLFDVFLDHGLQLRVTCLVQDYSRKQIVDQAQEKRLILVNLLAKWKAWFSSGAANDLELFKM